VKVEFYIRNYWFSFFVLNFPMIRKIKNNQWVLHGCLVKVIVIEFASDNKGTHS